MRRGIFGGKKHDKSKSGKVFGVSIVDVCQREESDMPLVVKDIIKYLEEKGKIIFFAMMSSTKTVIVL